MSTQFINSTLLARVQAYTNADSVMWTNPEAYKSIKSELNSFKAWVLSASFSKEEIVFAAMALVMRCGGDVNAFEKESKSW